jgi:hypothetical protein
LVHLWLNRRTLSENGVPSDDQCHVCGQATRCSCDSRTA